MTDTTVGAHNIKYEPLVIPQNVLLPPPHIKLRLLKQYVRALDKESAAFKYLRKFSEANVKTDFFIGPQVREIMERSELLQKLTERE